MRFQSSSSVDAQSVRRAQQQATNTEETQIGSKSCFPIVNAMTVDVEDYYQVSAFEPYIDRSTWKSFPDRVGDMTNRILDLFAEKQTQATFFTLGYVAEAHKDIVRRIVSEGHELASHGWYHHRVTDQTPEEFTVDVSRSKKVLEDISGVEVTGYRAPSYSITDKSLWAHDVLSEAGFRYSSSIAPIRHDHYGIPTAPRFAFKVNQAGLIEVPISTVNIRGSNYPCGGGGWFRLYPYQLSKLAVAHVNEQESRSCVFYFHPWEIDPDQPRIKGVNLKTRFRHYINLSSMESKIGSLLDDFSWGRMDDIYLQNTSSLPTKLLV